MPCDDVDQPRNWPAEHFHSELAFNIEETRKRIADIEDQLREKQFDARVQAKAHALMASLPFALGALDSRLVIMAQQLAAKAERQQMRYFEHVLVTPGTQFVADDPLFNVLAREAAYASSPEVAASPTYKPS